MVGIVRALPLLADPNNNNISRHRKEREEREERKEREEREEREQRRESVGD